MKSREMQRLRAMPPPSQGTGVGSSSGVPTGEGYGGHYGMAGPNGIVTPRGRTLLAADPNSQATYASGGNFMAQPPKYLQQQQQMMPSMPENLSNTKALPHINAGAGVAAAAYQHQQHQYDLAHDSEAKLPATATASYSQAAAHQRRSIPDNANGPSEAPYAAGNARSQVPPLPLSPASPLADSPTLSLCLPPSLSVCLSRKCTPRPSRRPPGEVREAERV
jgi:hypothetical protein